MQDKWLEAESKIVKDDSIDYPPSCSSSSGDSGSEVEEYGGDEADASRREIDPSSSSSM